MRVPRDLSGAELVKRLGRMGYRITRQTGSHLRLTSTVLGEHHITIRNHDPLRLVRSPLAAHHGLTRDALIQRLFE